MANVLKYDTNTGRVLDYRISVNTPNYLLDPNDVNTPLPGYLIHPDVSALQGTPKMFWIVKNGLVVEMTQAEKDATLLAKQQAQDNAERASIDLLEVTVKDVIIALVKRINIRIPSNSITKQEVIDQIKSDKGL